MLSHAILWYHAALPYWILQRNAAYILCDCSPSIWQYCIVRCHRVWWPLRTHTGRYLTNVIKVLRKTNLYLDSERLLPDQDFHLANPQPRALSYKVNCSDRTSAPAHVSVQRFMVMNVRPCCRRANKYECNCINKVAISCALAKWWRAGLNLCLSDALGFY